MLKQRILTALILLPLFVAALLYLPSAALGVLVGAVLMLGAVEWLKLLSLSSRGRNATLATFALLLFAGFFVAQIPLLVLAVLALAMVWWTVATAWIVRVQRAGAAQAFGLAKVLPGYPASALMMGAIVLWCPFVALMAVHQIPQVGPKLALFCLSLMWVADSAAYFAGRRFGRRKLASFVSPGKSWEGVFGALIATLVWSGIGVVVFGFSGAHAFGFVVLCVVTAGFSVVGDLFESMMKRHAHVKDSGQLLPGHGGVLDRIDSITAGAPLFGIGILVLVST